MDGRARMELVAPFPHVSRFTRHNLWLTDPALDATLRSPAGGSISTAALKSPLCDAHRQASLSGNGRASSFTVANWGSLDTLAGGRSTDLSSMLSSTNRFFYYW